MATVVITNVSATDPVNIGDLYQNIPPSGSITITRSVNEMMAMPALMAAMAAGTVTVSVTLSASELASGLTTPANSVEGGDTAAVAATDLIAIGVQVRKSFAAAAAGTADDVTIYAVNTLPFKFRVVNAWALVSTNIGGSTLDVRTAAGGLGTSLATMSSATTGYQPMTGPTASAVATPGASAGLFIRRSDRGVAGEVFLLVRKES